MSVFDESLSRRSFAKSAVAVSAGAVLGGPAAVSVLAQDATPVGEAHPRPPAWRPAPTRTQRRDRRELLRQTPPPRILQTNGATRIRQIPTCLTPVMDHIPCPCCV